MNPARASPSIQNRFFFSLGKIRMKEERKNTWFYAKAINAVYYNGVITINKYTY